MVFWHLDHEGPTGRVRVWDGSQAQYGQFTVMEREDFDQFKKLCEKYSWTLHECW